MPRILVLGSTGMLGHMVLKVLGQEKEWEVNGVDSKDFNVETFTPQDVSGYEYVINCIGALAGSDEVQMQKVNAEFPKRLAPSTHAKIIHMSTDGVFSGHSSPPPESSPIKGEEQKKDSPPLMGGVRGGWNNGYDEDSSPDAADAYGKSKLKGEVDAPNVINIRTSIIGPSPNKKKGLFEWFLSQPDGATIHGYTNHVWNGVTTLQFAQLCAKIIRQGVFGQLRSESSIFHFAPNDPVSKYELLCLLKKVFGKKVNVECAEDPRGKVERVMKTKYEGLKKLFPHGSSMQEAVEQLTHD